MLKKPNQKVPHIISPKTGKPVRYEQLPGTREYLERIEIGRIIAFMMTDGRLNTAKVANVSFRRKVLKAVTQYGEEHIVPFDSVLWVRTSRAGRWPRFILDILKQQGGRRNVVTEQAGK